MPAICVLYRQPACEVLRAKILEHIRVASEEAGSEVIAPIAAGNSTAAS